MLPRFFPSTLLLLLGALAALGQAPQNISVQPGGKKGAPAQSPIPQYPNTPIPKSLACADQDAGTISFANFVGQSSDISLDTMYFCLNDQINIIHNGDADLTGDPNPFTQPGVTYGIFDCPPTETGPNLATILTDPCITGTPPPANGIWVTGGGAASGNISFTNTGSVQMFFNGGDPVLLWYAPITIDNFALKEYENDPGTGESGPCVAVSTGEAFAVVFLNEIEISNLVANTGLSGCQGSFVVEGGLPEFDGSHYNIVIQRIGIPAAFGQVVSGDAHHGETVVFEVPLPGVYQIIVEDGKSCGGTALVDMSSCVSVSQEVQSVTAAPGDQICLNVTNEGGFLDIIAIQYALTWDESVLEFTGVQNLTPLLPGFNPATSFNSLGDSLIFSWGALSGQGVSLPLGTVIYQVCFDVVGGDGDCTSIDFVDPPGPGIEVVNENASQLGFSGVSGQVCVSALALVVNFTQDSVSCSGEDDGSFTVTVSGGQGPYQVTWQNLAGGSVQGPGTINLNGGSFTASNLDAGTYNVTVSDSQGAPLVATEQVEVFSPPILGLIFNEVTPACNGQQGSITAIVILDSVVVNNPDALYDFDWSNNAASQTITGIFSGLYSLTVTETATGCSVESATFLPQPPPLVVQVTFDTATCSGVGDGALHVIVFGGTPNSNGDYIIQWPTIGAPPGLIIVNATSNVTGLPADYYQLIVTDDNGCFFEQNIFLPAKKYLSVNAVIQPIQCNNACSGSIQVVGTTTSATGEPPAIPYNFDWFGAPVPPPPTATTPTSSTLNGLCAGVYTLVMEDAAGCEIDTTFILAEPPPLDAIVVEVENESCSPGSDGSITVAVSGGTYPYFYAWNGPSTDSTATGLTAGTYTVTVSDAAGCFDTLSATVDAPTGPDIVFLENDTLDCSNSTDGSLIVVANPGNAAIISYDWSNMDIGSSINGLSAGQYVVTVTDAFGCNDSDTALVVAPPPLVLDSIATMPPQCPGLGGGSIAVFASGGTAPYFFNWSNGVMGVGAAVIGGGSVTAGAYSVTITDDNGCQPPLTADITLDDPPSIVAVFSNIDSVSCANTGQTCDGTATATASYSDGSSGIFNFIWQSGATTTGAAASTAANLCQGMQQLIVSDNFCNDTFFVNIPAPPPITPGQDIDNVSCHGLSDGSITLLPSGGTPPYTITWLASGTVGPTLGGLPAGNHTANIVDAKGCTFTHTVTIIQPDHFDAFLNLSQTSDVACPGDENGIITVEVQGGNLILGPPVFLWQNGVAPPSSNSAQGLAPGTYSVTVVDAEGCQDSVTHTVTEPPPIQFTLGETAPVNCFGENTFITVDSVWGGNLATYQFSVDGGINRLPGELAPVFAGEHFIEVVDVVNGCTADTTITLAEPPQIQISLPEIVEIELGDSLTRLDPDILSALPIDTFIWTPADQLSCADCKNPFVIAVQPMLYTLTVVDVNGCTAAAQVQVDVDKNRNVYIPNVFSPNDDGINDKFQVFTGIGVTRIQFLRVYDRWGELMLDAADLEPSPDGTAGWDGRFRGERMNPAVFLYLIEVEFIDGQVLLYRGDVTLVR